MAEKKTNPRDAAIGFGVLIVIGVVIWVGLKAFGPFSDHSGKSAGAGAPATPPTTSSTPAGKASPSGTSGDLLHTSPNPAGGTPLCDATQAFYSRHASGTQVQVILHGAVDVSAEVDGKDGPLKTTGFLIPQGMGGHVFDFPTIPFADVTGVAIAASGDAGTGSCMAARVS